MKESQDDNNNNDIESLGSKEMFYFSQSDLIPNNIKEDFKTKENFFLVFVNTISGSRQGKTILEHAKKYRVQSISGYDVISFPVSGENLSKNKPKELDSNIFNNEIHYNDKHKSNYSAKFDPSIEFSTIIFDLIDKDEITKGIKFIKQYLKDLPNNKIKILAAGGDGTTLNLVDD
jgi:hypothetical protein